MIGPKTERSLLYGGRGWERCCTGRHSTTAASYLLAAAMRSLEADETLDRALTYYCITGDWEGLHLA